MKQFSKADIRRILTLIKDIDLVYIDLFCGAGGLTTGVEEAEIEGRKAAMVIICVNHDKKAIESHKANHPHAIHLDEDIRLVKMAPIKHLVALIRRLYPEKKIILWASAECTNYSKAKGGKSRNADSRTLPEHLGRYVSAIKPDLFQLENVIEFQAWGPLCWKAAKMHKDRCDLAFDKHGEPVMTPASMKNGKYYLRWVERIKGYGYEFQSKEINAADHGAYTSRIRYFAQFARPGIPIRWPQATHSKKPALDMFGELKPWKAVREVLDFTKEGKSIIDREDPLCDKTLERVYAGLVKFVAGGKEHFLAKHFSGKPEGKVTSIAQPAGTVTTWGNQSLVSASFLASYYSGSKCVSSLDKPAPTVTNKDRIALVESRYFLDKQYSSGKYNNQSVDDPAGTLTTVPKLNLVAAEPFILNKNSSTAPAVGVKNPSPTITSRQHYLVEPKPWIMNTSYNNVGSDIDEPCSTITANRKWHYLVNPSWYGMSSSIDKPSPVIIARGDKAPLYLVETNCMLSDQQQINLEHFFNQWDWQYCKDAQAEVYGPQVKRSIRVDIIEFMVLHGIVDIKMRMLTVNELLRIQGFPEDYFLAGNQADKKKFIGNAVEVTVAKRITEATAQAIWEYHANQSAA